MGALLLFVLLVETFAVGLLFTRCRDLKEENDLLRESMPFYHTYDWEGITPDGE